MIDEGMHEHTRTMLVPLYKVFMLYSIGYKRNSVTEDIINKDVLKLINAI